MKQTNVLLGLIFCTIIFASMVSAAPPVKSTPLADSIDIEHPVIDPMQVNQDHEFNFHIYNLTNGKPYISTSNIICSFHLYNASGSHIFINNNLSTNSYDYTQLITAKNFSKFGQYSFVFQCNNSNSGGFYSHEFTVNDTGRIEPTGIVTIFFIGSFLLVLLFMTYLLLSSIGHLMEKNFDILDLAWDYGIYFVLIGLYIFEEVYIGNSTIHSILEVLVIVGAFTHMVAATIFFIISMIWAGMQKTKQKQGVK